MTNEKKAQRLEDMALIPVFLDRQDEALLREAAALEGCGRWQFFWRITFPPAPVRGAPRARHVRREHDLGDVVALVLAHRAAGSGLGERGGEGSMRRAREGVRCVDTCSASPGQQCGTPLHCQHEA